MNTDMNWCLYSVNDLTSETWKKLLEENESEDRSNIFKGKLGEWDVVWISSDRIPAATLPGREMNAAQIEELSRLILNRNLATCSNQHTVDLSQCENLTIDNYDAISWLGNTGKMRTKISARDSKDLNGQLERLLQKFPYVQHIEISSFPDNIEFDFGRFRNLETVHLSDCENLHDATAASLAACPNLETVNLSKCHYLTDAAVTPLAACPNLHSVNLHDCWDITDKTAVSLAKCPSLHTIRLSDCYSLTDATVASLATCPNLHSVDLSGCRELTDATAASLAHCPNLWLDF